MLKLSDDLAYSFIGALISIARIDGEVTVDEGRVLREIAGEISTGDDFDFEFALTMNRSVTEFAGELRKSGDPFRESSGNASVEQIREAFIAAARRVAAAEDGQGGGEERLIRDFTNTLSIKS